MSEVDKDTSELDSAVSGDVVKPVPDPAIIVEHLSKTFSRISKFQDNVTESIKKPKNWSWADDSFHALKDISFTVNKGEVLGIIGKNGAGKSTLLKILAGITKPSSGKVTLNGRVSSILDIGAGFHPELSGRENVYLVGNLNGFKNSEIDLIFDKILSFSEIGDFIEMPVKHYSSGMFLRLAFSVVIHFMNDIIVLDEVMAVGDSKFQLKCQKEFARLKELNKTLIIVSHSPHAIANFSDTCIVLEKGEIVAAGNPEEVVSQYVMTAFKENRDEENEKRAREKAENADSQEEAEEEIEEEEEEPVVELDTLTLEELRRKEQMEAAVIMNQVSWKKEPTTAPATDHVKIWQISARNKTRTENGKINNFDEILVEIEYEKMHDEELRLGLLVKYQIFSSVLIATPYRTAQTQSIVSNAPPGRYKAVCEFPRNFFNKGIYSFDLFFTTMDHKNVMKCINQFNCRIFGHPDANNTESKFDFIGEAPVPLAPVYDWKVTKLKD